MKPKTNPSNERRGRPIFIVGAPRSGTTLLQYMLRSHSRISLPTGESHFFIPLHSNAQSFGDLRRSENIRRVLEEMYRRSAEFLETDLHGLQFEVASLAKQFEDEGRDTIPKIISGLYEKNATGEGKQRWGDKTPYYVRHIPTLLEMFPDAQVIHLIRDGRDCALSMFARRHDFYVYNTYFAAKYWQNYVNAGQIDGGKLPADTYLEVRYEDILVAPETTMREVFAFLDEEYEDSVVHFRKARGGGKTPLLRQPLQGDNSNKWRGQMTPRQVRIFEGVAASTLARNGYPVVTPARPLPLFARAFYRAHNKAISWHAKRRPDLRN